jgi:anti-anti-sigma factor
LGADPKDIPIEEVAIENAAVSRGGAAQLNIAIPAKFSRHVARWCNDMEITTQQFVEALEVKVKGRLDNYWSEHLQRNLEEIMRGGAHVIWLNLSELKYLSSAGVGLLVRFYRQLKDIGGSLVITNPSEHVKMVVEACKLSPLLFAERKPAAPAVRKAEVRRFSSAVASFELQENPAEKPLVCRRVGDPDLLQGCRFTTENCKTAEFPVPTFGLGLGAFGNGFEDAQARFGEFIAVGGCAAYLPTDGTNVPDFMISRGDLVPELNVLYGLRCEGDFTQMLRFEAANAANPITLSELVRTALESSGAATIGMAMLAESAGLVGAALRRSPAAAHEDTGAPFQYPEICKWLSFSTERLYSRSLALVAGVATIGECKLLNAMLRRLGTAEWPAGHFHAAAFSYRPLQKGEIDLRTTVSSLFETENLQGVLHLLSDGREAAGLQQSEFVRGACWISKLAEIQ